MKLELRELYWTLDALLNLYYPTEDLSYTILLGYYEQREWRITPNFSHNREWHYPRVEGGNRDKLLMLNQDFFGKKLETTGRPRIEDCLSFQNVAGKRLLDNAAALIVPDDVIDAAQKLVAQKGFGFTVVKASEHK